MPTSRLKGVNASGLGRAAVGGKSGEQFRKRKHAGKAM